MSRSVETILAATSLGPTSDEAIAAAAALARHTGADLHLIHAYSTPFAYFAIPSGLTTVDTEVFAAQSELAQRLLDEQLARIELAPDAVADVAIVAGAAHRMTVQRADEIDADLIVIGAGDPDADTPLLGSTAERIVRGTHCPVLVERGTLQVPPERLLVPLDLSAFGESSARRGLDLLRRLGMTPKAIDALLVLAPAEIEHARSMTIEQIDRLAHAELARAANRLGKAGKKTLEPTVRVGPVAREIVAQVEESGADLLLLGTHGHSGFERFLIGSVAAQVAHHAPCSMLVVPPPDEDDD